METTILKEEFIKKLKNVYPMLDCYDKIDVCYHLKISTSTLHRYLNGNFGKDLEMAENIILQANKILKLKRANT